MDGVEKAGLAIAGCRALLAGCGGAGSAIALELLERGATHLAIHDIDIARRDAAVKRLSARFPARVGVGCVDPSGFDLIANATPMGMRPDDPLPVDVGKLRPHQFAACVVTLLEAPSLIGEARRRGCRVMTGTEMFDAQAETLVDFLLGTNDAGAGQEQGGIRNFSSP